MTRTSKPWRISQRVEQPNVGPRGGQPSWKRWTSLKMSTRRRGQSQSRRPRRSGVITVLGDGSALPVRRGLATPRACVVWRVRSGDSPFEAASLNIKTTKSLLHREGNGMRPRASRFRVDYTYGKDGGSQTRVKLTTSTTNLYNPATRSETGILSYLRHRHPGLEITILDLEFLNASGVAF
jgi:hypothetical protein